MKQEIEIIDEHIEAFLFWEDLRRQGKISKIDSLLHVDSHDDIGMPHILDESLYSIVSPKKFAEKNLHIFFFILPAAIRGCFSTVYFLNSINPPDKDKKRVVEDDVSVKKDKDKRKKKSFKKKRHIKLYSWQDEGRIWYQNLTAHGRKLAACQKKHEVLFNPIYTLNSLKKNKEIILDIDMDYFTCNNFEDYQYHPKLTQKQILEAQKFSISDDSYKMNLGLVTIENGKFIKATAYANNDKNVTIYNDDPVWIDYAIREFVVGLRRIKPKYVSMCRSVKTGYLPVKHAPQVEQTLKECLKCSEKVSITPPHKATFKVNNFIDYDEQKGKVINQRNLEAYYFELKVDKSMWEMIKSGAMFGDVIERLVKDFKYPEKKAEKELISNVWYLKKEGVLK